MRYAKVLAAVLALSACTIDSEAPPQRSAWLEPAGKLPPVMFQDCVDLVLLDDRCVRIWYDCTRGKDREACVDMWESCCTLPGRGKRSSYARSHRPVDR